MIDSRATVPAAPAQMPGAATIPAPVALDALGMAFRDLPVLLEDLGDDDDTLVTGRPCIMPPAPTPCWTGVAL